MLKEIILVIDFGSQYTALILRRIRELNVYCELVDCDEQSPVQLHQYAVKGVILSGGPESVVDSNSPKIPAYVFDLEVPVLGVCYGMHLLVTHFGGSVDHAINLKGSLDQLDQTSSEFGSALLTISQSNPLFQKISTDIIQVWMSHSDLVNTTSEQIKVIAFTKDTPNAAVQINDHYYGVQFHPEVHHTEFGLQIISNFVFGICDIESSWTSESIVDQLVAEIRETVGDKQVVLGLSGGVDSSVVATLIHKAIGNQLHCLLIDNGLLRENEANKVVQIFSEKLPDLTIQLISAEDRFLDALEGLEDPEDKRKCIGKVFVDVFQEEAKKLTSVEFLAQGTIYSDVIESAHAQKKSHVIKSHHNVGGIPETLHLTLLEPLRFLFKDEVRLLGSYLGLSDQLIHRHPFPGPGLGIRVLGVISKTFLDILRIADRIFIEHLERENLYSKVSQAFAVFLPVKSVGVVGDARRYGYIIALRAVVTSDFMTGQVAELPSEFIQKVATEIVNQIPEVSRVVYDYSTKPPATIEWE